MCDGLVQLKWEVLALLGSIEMGFVQAANGKQASEVVQSIAGFLKLEFKDFIVKVRALCGVCVSGIHEGINAE
jgi:hypothetical protein